MDFVNKLYAQLVELFRSMSPAARITTALLLGVLVVSLVYLFRYQVVGQDELLLDGREFPSSELAQMEAAFAQAGLNGSTIDGNRIRIPRGQKDEYLAALADNGALPSDLADIFDSVFESENTLTGTSELRAQKLKNAKEKYMSMVVSKMKGVEWATVKFDEDADRGRLRPNVDKRAGVAVKPRGSTSLDQDRVQSIRDTVAAFVARLDPKNVTVTDLNVGRAHVGSGHGASGVDSAYAAAKSRYETYWREKVEAQLAVYPGVVVGVDVELDPKLMLETNTFEVDPTKSLATEKSEDRSTENTTGPAPSGRPGAVPNGVVNQPQTVAANEAGTRTEKTTNKSDQKVISPRSTSFQKDSGLTPQRVKVSIGVPNSYFTSVWRERNPTPEGEDPATPEPSALLAIETETKQAIEETVANLLPVPPIGGDPFTPVRVTTFTSIPADEMEEPGVTDQAMNWLAGNWQTLGMTLLGLFALLMLRGMLKSSVVPSTPESSVAVAGATGDSTTLADLPGDEEEVEEDESGNNLRNRFRSSGPSLRDELADMVKEDPDAAANVLRNWIGDAA